jgi:hypothetical protein
VNREIRTLGDDRQIVFGHDGRDLDDHAMVGIEPCHFQVDPNEPSRSRHAPNGIAQGGEASRIVMLFEK